jgi:hypothetical protein
MEWDGPDKSHGPRAVLSAGNDFEDLEFFPVRDGIGDGDRDVGPHHDDRVRADPPCAEHLFNRRGRTLELDLVGSLVETAPDGNFGRNPPRPLAVANA